MVKIDGINRDRTVYSATTTHGKNGQLRAIRS
jgi:hypothetical protein